MEEVGICPEYHWRRGSFHLIVREPHQNILTLTLHRDAHIGYPPFHKPIFIGKAVKEEFDKIVTAYHARMKSNITGQTGGIGVGKKSRERMTDLTYEQRVTRSHKHRQKRKEEEAKMAALVAAELARQSLARFPIFLGGRKGEWVKRLP